jgi:hypothetical protein
MSLADDLRDSVCRVPEYDPEAVERKHGTSGLNEKLATMLAESKAAEKTNRRIQIWIMAIASLTLLLTAIMLWVMLQGHS